MTLYALGNNAKTDSINYGSISPFIEQEHKKDDKEEKQHQLGNIQ